MIITRRELERTAGVLGVPVGQLKDYRRRLIATQILDEVVDQYTDDRYALLMAIRGTELERLVKLHLAEELGWVR